MGGIKEVAAKYFFTPACVAISQLQQYELNVDLVRTNSFSNKVKARGGMLVLRGKKVLSRRDGPPVFREKLDTGA